MCIRDSVYLVVSRCTRGAKTVSRLRIQYVCVAFAFLWHCLLYTSKRLLCRAVVVQGNPRVYKALRDELATVLAELWRIRDGANVDSELLDTIRMIAAIMGGMKED